MTDDQPRRRLSLEREFVAAVEAVWALWTTPAGIESWWGPEGFTVTVRAMDLRPGGVLRYAMTATGADQVGFMQRAGMPLTTEATITYREIVPLRRLSYVHLADFVPGVAAYDVATEVELLADGGRVRMALSFDAMHDEEWSSRMVQGWESELGKLERVLARGAR